MDLKEYQHEVIVTNEGLPFKLFAFEGQAGGYVRDKHWHRSIEIFAVWEGKMYFTLHDNKFQLNGGEFVIVNSNEVHSIVAPEVNRTVVLQIPQDTFAANKLQVLSLYYELLYILVTKYRKFNVNDEILKNSKQLKKLSNITRFMKDHYAESLTLESMAEQFNYSPSYLSRMFQKHAGINFKDYLLGIRLEHAVRELEETNGQIVDIALGNGFPNSKSFSNAFREKYGILPSEYRRRNNS